MFHDVLRAKSADKFTRSRIAATHSPTCALVHRPYLMLIALAVNLAGRSVLSDSPPERKHAITECGWLSAGLGDSPSHPFDVGGPCHLPASRFAVDERCNSFVKREIRTHAAARQADQGDGNQSRRQRLRRLLPHHQCARYPYTATSAIVPLHRLGGSVALTGTLAPYSTGPAQVH